MNSIYSYNDAVTVVKNLIEQKREERDSYGIQPEHSGLFVSWDLFYEKDAELHALKQVLETLTDERVVQGHIAEYNVREDRKASVDA